MTPGDNAAAYQQQRLADGAACLAAALRYLTLGWPVLPNCPPDHVGESGSHRQECDHPGKAPPVRWKEFQSRLPTESEVRGWWRHHPTRNVGAALGGPGRLVRIDVDGPAGEEELQRLSVGDLPTTLEFTSGRTNGGRGLLYRLPEGVTRRTAIEGARVGEELRLMAEGAQTVLPPSRHESTALYAWAPGRGPDDVQVAAAPAWLLDALRQHDKARPSRNGKHSPGAGERIPEGERDSTLTSLAGTMRRRGMSEDAILAALLVENERRCDPPLPDEQVRKIAASVARYAPAAGGNGTYHPPPGGQAPGGTAAGQTAYDIILAYLRERYEPTFKRGQALYSAALGREVRMGEIAVGPPRVLVERLLQAIDCPFVDTTAGRVARRERVPQLFRTWLGSAVADLLAELPDEHAAGEVAEAAAMEFRRRVAAAMHKIVTMGREIQEKRGKEVVTVTRLEQRSLLQWCRLWGKPGRRWGDVRGYELWCRLDQQTQELQVALRRDLFAQVGPPELARLSQRELSDLAQLYAVGRPDRAGSVRAIVLEPAFLAELASAPAEDDDDDADDALRRAHARSASSASSRAPAEATDSAPVQEKSYAGDRGGR